MAKFKNGAGSGGVALPGVTAENYIIPADKFENAEGTAMEYAKAAGSCFMIDNSMHREQTIWRKYFHVKGMGKRVKEMNRWLEEKGQYAVPSQWPWQFDQSVSEDMCK